MSEPTRTSHTIAEILRLPVGVDHECLIPALFNLFGPGDADTLLAALADPGTGMGEGAPTDHEVAIAALALAYVTAEINPHCNGWEDLTWDMRLEDVGDMVWTLRAIQEIGLAR